MSKNPKSISDSIVFDNKSLSSIFQYHNLKSLENYLVTDEDEEPAEVDLYDYENKVPQKINKSAVGFRPRSAVILDEVEKQFEIKYKEKVTKRPSTSASVSYTDRFPEYEDTGSFCGSNSVIVTKSSKSYNIPGPKRSSSTASLRPSTSRSSLVSSNSNADLSSSKVVKSPTGKSLSRSASAKIFQSTRPLTPGPGAYFPVDIKAHVSTPSFSSSIKDGTYLERAELKRSQSEMKLPNFSLLARPKTSTPGLRFGPATANSRFQPIQTKLKAKLSESRNSSSSTGSLSELASFTSTKRSFNKIGLTPPFFPQTDNFHVAAPSPGPTHYNTNCITMSHSPISPDLPKSKFAPFSYMKSDYSTTQNPEKNLIALNKAAACKFNSAEMIETHTANLERKMELAKTKVYQLDLENRKVAEINFLKTQSPELLENYLAVMEAHKSWVVFNALFSRTIKLIKRVHSDREWRSICNAFNFARKWLDGFRARRYEKNIIKIQRSYRAWLNRKSLNKLVAKQIAIKVPAAKVLLKFFQMAKLNALKVYIREQFKEIFRRIIKLQQLWRRYRIRKHWKILCLLLNYVKLDYNTPLLKSIQRPPVLVPKFKAKIGNNRESVKIIQTNKNNVVPSETKRRNSLLSQEERVSSPSEEFKISSPDLESPGFSRYKSDYESTPSRTSTIKNEIPSVLRRNNGTPSIELEKLSNVKISASSIEFSRPKSSNIGETKARRNSVCSSLNKKEPSGILRRNHGAPTFMMKSPDMHVDYVIPDIEAKARRNSVTSDQEKNSKSSNSIALKSFANIKSPQRMLSSPENFASSRKFFSEDQSPSKFRSIVISNITSESKEEWIHFPPDLYRIYAPKPPRRNPDSCKIGFMFWIEGSKCAHKRDEFIMSKRDDYIEKIKESEMNRKKIEHESNLNSKKAARQSIKFLSSEKDPSKNQSLSFFALPIDSQTETKRTRSSFIDTEKLNFDRSSSKELKSVDVKKQGSFALTSEKSLYTGGSPSKSLPQREGSIARSTSKSFTKRGGSNSFNECNEYSNSLQQFQAELNLTVPETIMQNYKSEAKDAFPWPSLLYVSTVEHEREFWRNFDRVMRSNIEQWVHEAADSEFLKARKNKSQNYEDSYTFKKNFVNKLRPNSPTVSGNEIDVFAPLSNRIKYWSILWEECERVLKNNVETYFQDLELYKVKLAKTNTQIKTSKTAFNKPANVSVFELVSTQKPAFNRMPTTFGSIPLVIPPPTCPAMKVLLSNDEFYYIREKCTRESMYEEVMLSKIGK